MLNLKNSVKTIEITMDKDNFVNQCNVVFVGVDNYHYLQQFAYDGNDNFVVNVKGDIYKFLIEDIDISNANIDTFTLWGRSKGAILADERYKTPSDYNYTQLISAYDVLQQLCAGLTIELNFLNFYLLPNALSMSNVLPIEVIKKVVDVGGLVLFSRPDGTLVFEDYYKFSPILELQDQPYVDSFDYLDNIFDMNIDFVSNSNMNAVRVIGGSDIEGNKGFILELDSDLNRGKTTFQPSDIVYVRVYPIGDINDYEILLNTGYYFYMGEHEYDIIKEEIIIDNTEINLKYPISTLNSIEFDDNVFDMPDFFVGQPKLIFDFDNTKVSIGYVNYTTKYYLYKTTREDLGKLLFYITETEV